MRPSLKGKAKNIEHTLTKLAVVIPAHNEAPVILRCLESIARCSRPRETLIVETVVIADNCDDATAIVADQAGARVIVRVDQNNRGKGFALTHAFEKLIGERFDAFLVIDADTIVEANLLTEIVTLLDAGADGAQVKYCVLNPDATIRTRLMHVAFMAMNVLRPRGRERWNFSAGISGNGFALTRTTLEGVPYDAHSVVEDLEYHIRLVRSGRRIAFAHSTTVRAEMPTGRIGMQTQRARWEGGRLRMIAENVPALVHDVATGKIRMLEPLLDLLLLPLGFHVALLACALSVPFAPSRIYSLAALALVAVHVSTAVIVSGGDLSDFAVLFASPFYVFCKILLAPQTVKSASRDAAWIRTER